MRRFVVTLDPGAWPDPAALIKRALEADFGPVEVASVAALQPASQPRRDRGIADLVERVSQEMKVPAAAIVGESRVRYHAHARFAVMWLARKGYGRSSVVIGKALGNRDHSTVLHGIRRAQEMRCRNMDFRRVTSGLLRELMESRQ